MKMLENLPHIHELVGRQGPALPTIGHARILKIESISKYRRNIPHLLDDFIKFSFCIVFRNKSYIYAGSFDSWVREVKYVHYPISCKIRIRFEKIFKIR